MLVCVLSGPSAGRAPLLAKLNREGVGIDSSLERAQNPSHHLPRDKKTEWITAFAESLEPVEKALENSKWRLRMHYEKPAHVGRPDPIAELTKRIEALEAR